MEQSRYKSLFELPNRILQVVAHPDDEIIYGGGTVALNQEIGGLSHIVCLSGSEADGPSRKAEFEASCKTLGVSYDLFKLPQGQFKRDHSVHKRLGAIIEEYKPTFIMTHSPYDFHSDHKDTREIAWQTALNHQTSKHGIQAFLFTEGYTPHMLPEVNALIDVGSVTSKVLNALESHQSQEKSLGHYKRTLKARWALRGVNASCDEAEAFILKPLPVSNFSIVPNYSKSERKQS